MGQNGHCDGEFTLHCAVDDMPQLRLPSVVVVKVNGAPTLEGGRKEERGEE